MSSDLPPRPAARSVEDTGVWPDPVVWKRRRLRRTLAAFNLYRRPRPECIRFGYEKAGLAVYDEAIPWNAEAVLLEALVWMPKRLGRDPTLFSLALPGYSPPALPILCPVDNCLVRVILRLTPPRVATPLWLCWRSAPLARVELPFLSADEFVRRLILRRPTVSVGLGSHHVPCRTAVNGQGRNVLAYGLLTSPTRLLPLADLRFQVLFEQRLPCRRKEMPILLTRAQLTDRQALVVGSLPDWSEAATALDVHWLVEDRVLDSQALQSLPRSAFLDSLRLIDSGYLCEGPDGRTAFRAYLPARAALIRVAPCFRVSSRIPGAAGVCSLEIRAQGAGSGATAASPIRLDALISDGPSLITPPLMAPEDFLRAGAYELVCDGKVLGSLLGCPRPRASFTSEGSFQLSSDGDWLPVDEQELVDRLGQLT